MRVLITYGSKHGGTAGIAETITRAVEAAGGQAILAPAREIKHIHGFDAVIIGGALYSNRWHRDARSLVRKHAGTLRSVQTWLFSSGPLDDSASDGEIPPVRQVRALMAKISARGHATFGGRLEPDVGGFLAANMAKTQAGDWRDNDQITRWVRDIIAEVGLANA